MLLVAAAVLAVLGAVACRRLDPATARLAVATTTLVALGGAAVAWTATAGLVPRGAPSWLALVAVAVAAPAAVLGSARAVPRVRARLPERTGTTLLDRADAWAARHPARIGSRDWLPFVLRCVRRAIDVRVTGLAAEMTYYALISVVPLTSALGASLGYLERFTDPERVSQIEDGVIGGVSGVLADDVAQDALVPLVRSLLREERTGFAVGSVLLTLFLASRMFRAAIRALDDAYRVPERRGLLAQGVLGLALALGAVVTLLVILVLVVVGPLLGGGEEIAGRLGLGAAFSTTWALARWPVAVAVAIAYLTLLYRYGPHQPAGTTWRRAVPGALVGTLGLLLVAGGFAVYLRVAGPAGLDVDGQGTVQVAAQVLGVVLAAVLWLWVSAIVTLTGGVVNAVLQELPPDDDAAPAPGRPPGQASVPGGR
ncbi:YihY/virulence factor BrkB family protein [Cellulomonas sp. Sa3CUA2]|uniref:YihY/virulence factor BrkB family protein n=1 Tax=Cellulomonas avistercoris TaxID=2762242 RepID=A0ABR8QC13_9CELL|nr:YihY/virulence factor BrkB family protein [Cellulomonas avistercoris]MBD7917955.1 YihY/virulence factor BrkB family protein [Cellulomonas avistercoris]